MGARGSISAPANPAQLGSFIKYMDKDGEISERWISPKEVIWLTDYIYLQAFCHTRNADRTFRLDRMIEVAVEVEKE